MTALVYAALVLGVPTFYTAAILRQLDARERALERQTQALALDPALELPPDLPRITTDRRKLVQIVCWPTPPGSRPRAAESGCRPAPVRRLCDLLGGDVSVESDPDVGSTSTVALPLAPPA